MTNKVKPFYIRITDDMTPQMVQDAFDKCRELGVKDTELRDSLDCSYWVYFGVCGRDGLCYSDWSNSFHGDAQEITLDQLDEWLGLEVEQEWKNGDECVYNGDLWQFVSLLSSEFHGTAVIFDRISEELKQVDFSRLEKPEAPEQKAERERQYAVYDMCSDLDNHTDDARFWCEKLYDAGYRKQ